MAYDIQRKKFSREKFYLVELFAPYCDLSYGVAPCTASGGPKCYNTFGTCQDRVDFTPSTKAYRFCSARSPIPPGVPNFIMPTITGVNFTAPSVDVTGGLGVRASVAVTFADAPSGDIDTDKYVNERTYMPHQQGTFWGKWRARNPFYEDLKVIVWSGFLNDDGSYSADNMQRREYVVTGLQVGNGKAKLDARDPLKLAEGLKSQYPAKSTGELLSDITTNATSATLAPAGVGDAEYPASGFIRISSEVIGFTRTGDTLTLTRAQYNTLPAAHSSGDAVQLCALENSRVDMILTKLLTQAAAVDPAYINTADWAAEASANYPTSLERLITAPESVEDLIKELCETCPSYIYWDERVSLIRWEAVQAPAVDLGTLNDRDHMVGDLTYVDQLKLRASRVIVYSAQVDPTKKRDEVSNYAQTYIRVDSDAENAAGSPAIKTIYSRWLSQFNKAGAVLLATRLGRRFAQAPRLVNFTLTSKDTEYWLGSSAILEHPELQQFDGSAGTLPVQVVSVAEKPSGYVYGALELYWGEDLPDDAPDGVDLVIIGGDVRNINLRTIYDSLYPAPTVDSVVRFVVDTSVEVGSDNPSLESMNTGSWPSGMPPIQLVVRGAIAGRGGVGSPSVTVPGGPGSNALVMNYNVTILSISGLIGGGGGGGGASSAPIDGDPTPETGSGRAIGGGGAGSPRGFGSPNGSLTNGGITREFTTPDMINYKAGNGGDLGQPGENGVTDFGASSAGGAAGAAIITNGYTLTIESGSGNIFGAII